MAKRLEKIDTETTETRLAGFETYYITKQYTGFAWMCEGCGLVWDKRHLAESCGERGHVARFEQRYGGRVENGQHVGGSRYERKALRRERVTATS